MKWICLGLFLGISLYLQSSENHLEVQQKPPLCTYFSNSSMSLDDETEAEAPCIRCPPPPDKPVLSLAVIFDLKYSVEAQPCCFVYAPPDAQPEDLLKHGKLSFYWAQELIGSDLLRQELKDVSGLPENFIAVFDTGDNKKACASHANKVENIISDSGRHAILPELGDRIKFYSTNWPQDYRDASGDMSDNLFYFINNSMSWENEDMMRKAFSNIPSSSVIVISAGSYYPNPMDPLKVETSAKSNTILVGSLDPDGLISKVSQQGTEVHILAPAGRDELTSANKRGAYCNFGATSGAAPLVTGSLAAFEWLSGYHPTREEAKILLEKTAIPTLHSAFGDQNNGKGLLNTYKLGRLATTLKEYCGKKPEEEKIKCFKQKIEIGEDETYDFPIDKEFIYSHIHKSFPECNGHDNENSSTVPHISSCEEKQKALEILRKNVLLSPQQADLWAILSCIYQKNGFTQNAQMLDRIRAAAAKDESFLNQLYEGGVEDQVKWVRLISNRGGEQNKEKLRHLFTSENTSSKVKTAIAQSAMALKEKFGAKMVWEILNKLATDSSLTVKGYTAFSARRLGGEEGDKIIKTLQKDKDSCVREQADHLSHRVVACLEDFFSIQ